MFLLIHLLAAFLSPACHALSNVCDKRLGEDYAEHIGVLVALSKVIQLSLVVVVLVFWHPDLSVSPTVWLIMLAVTATEYLYVYPYFWAFQHADTSVVASLFSLGKIVMPLLAWLWLGEVLHVWQYAGFLLIIGASLLLTFNWRHFHLNRAVVWMLLSSLLISCGSLLTKQAFNADVPWATFLVLTLGLDGLVGSLILAARPRTTWTLLWQATGSTRQLVLSEGLLSGVGTASYLFALTALPVTVMKGISSSQPLFVLIGASLIGPRFPSLFDETKSNFAFSTKFLAFSLMVFGTILTLL